ncbi:plasmid pRiA4b ORF-3 family protein [Zavarzinia sp.]|uniref:plasmid pRiA4b ORF-3 family protein n=1 Tax=Zavarzinia sp. TaxID=2027920 RepID=UPI003BB4939A
MTTTAIARLKIKLDDVKPAVMRRIEVPLALRLDRLHLVLQVALGWTDSHLYEFRFRDVGFGIPDPDWEHDILDARKAKLEAVIADTGARSFKYLYNFGDGWEHTVKVEKIAPATPDVDYPLLLGASGRCPPEDVGGGGGRGDTRSSSKPWPILTMSSITT